MRKDDLAKPDTPGAHFLFHRGWQFNTRRGLWWKPGRGRSSATTSIPLAMTIELAN